MCIPALGLVVGLVGSAVSAAGAMAQADAQASSSEYNAAVAKENAKQERQKGVVQQEGIGRKYAQTIGEGIANTSKGGLDSSYGSAALAIFGENNQNKYADQSNAYVNAESAAIGQENKARDLEAQAKAQRSAGKIGAASSFLSGLGGVAKSAAQGGALSING